MGALYFPPPKWLLLDILILKALALRGTNMSSDCFKPREPVQQVPAETMAASSRTSTSNDTLRTYMADLLNTKCLLPALTPVCLLHQHCAHGCLHRAGGGPSSFHLTKG